MDDKLKTAVARLADFRASWEDGDCIDADSKLTADDLDTILEWMKLTKDLVAIEYASALPTRPR
jgi:hypothetical protein